MRRLKVVVDKTPSLAHRDFLLDALVADDCLKQWQHEIANRRATLQKYVSCLSQILHIAAGPAVDEL